MAKKKVIKPTDKPDIVINPPYDYSKVLSEIDRVAALGMQLAGKVNQDSLKALYLVNANLEIPELQAKLKAPGLTVIQRSVLMNCIQAITHTNKDRLEASKHVEDRGYGKMANKTELTGQNGGAIKIEAENKTKLNSSLANMTDEELAEVEKLANKMQTVIVGSTTELIDDEN